jgi:F420-dependent oxidoreductase-like protein
MNSLYINIFGSHKYMKGGLQIIRFDWSNRTHGIRDRLRDIAKLADQSGFYSLWVMDHLFQMGDEFGPADAPMLEGYSTINYLAGITQRVRLGTMVTGNSYRGPGLLIKMVSTLDVLSGGRAYLGIGAGWYKREARGLGLLLPDVKERFERLEETLQIAKHMWSGQRMPYLGRYYQLQEPINSPQPLQQPHPRILIGGEGEKKTLRLVAQYGDACNLHAGGNRKEYPAGIESIRSKLAILQKHCDIVGRPYKDIERTALAGVDLSQVTATSDAARLCASLEELGVEHVIFNIPNAHDFKLWENFVKEIIPAVKKVS